MRRTISLLLLSFLCTLAALAQGGLEERLAALEGISGVERLESDVYTEKYLVRITQQVDPQDASKGTFTQRVVVGHAGFDRPTVLVTEGYSGTYALNARYHEELTDFLDANLVFVEHRYFLESTPEPCDWDYLTAENAAADLHRVNLTFRNLYPGKWISTGISKGGQTATFYRVFYPDDVDVSVPYVGPLCRGVEDGRHEKFLRKVGTRSERRTIERFQREVLQRKAEMLPLLEAYSKEKSLRYRITPPEVLDYCVLEYPFSIWQWGTPVTVIPPTDADTKTLFDHLMAICGAEYFAEDQPNAAFFVQAARELGYYGYDTKPFRRLLSIGSSKGYLDRIMLPSNLTGTIAFDATLYNRTYTFLRDNDPKMIFIYGEVDPWSAVHVPLFKGKKNEQVYFQPRGSHLSRIGNMPEDVKQKILAQLKEWLEE